MKMRTVEDFERLKKRSRRLSRINKILGVLLIAATLNLILLIFGINIIKEVKEGSEELFKSPVVSEFYEKAKDVFVERDND